MVDLYSRLAHRALGMHNDIYARSRQVGEPVVSLKVVQLLSRCGSDRLDFPRLARLLGKTLTDDPRSVAG